MRQIYCNADLCRSRPVWVLLVTGTERHLCDSHAAPHMQLESRPAAVSAPDRYALVGAASSRRALT